MSQQLSAGRALRGPKCFSLVPAVSSPRCCRTCVFPPAAPFGAACGVWRSLWNEDGCQEISSGRGGRGSWDVRHSSNGGTRGSRGRGVDRSCTREGLGWLPMNKDPLQPLGVRIHPQGHCIPLQDTEQTKGLNQFACLVDKVRCLEQRNRVLATKWDLLQKQVLPPQNNLQQDLEDVIRSLQGQLDLLLQERGQMKLEQNDKEKLVEKLKCKCEQEVAKHTAAKKLFMLLKKDADSVYLTKAELQVKLEMRKRETELLQCVFAQETAELERSVRDTSVIVRTEHSRGLAVHAILKRAERCYEDMAWKSKAELDALYRTRYQELEEAKGRHYSELRSHQQEVGELSLVTRRWQRDLEDMKKQVSSLQASVYAAENRGNCALKDAREKHVELQNALHKAKDELACMLRDHRELLNVKLALDIEIATYKTVLESEEGRTSTGIPGSMLVSAPCNIICGPDCGAGLAGTQSRGPWSLCGAGRASFPADFRAYQQGFTSRSTASSAARSSVPGATGWSSISRSGELRPRSGDYSCQGSVLQDTDKHHGGTKEMGEKSCRAGKSLGSSAHSQGMYKPKMRISTGPLCKTRLSK